jgi:hypothetical protein
MSLPAMKLGGQSASYYHSHDFHDFLIFKRVVTDLIAPIES